MNFTRYVAPNIFLTGSVSATLFGASNVNFQQISGASDFTSMFDFYRINAFKVFFYLDQEPGAAATVNTAQYPQIHWTIDRDDTTSYGAVSDMRQSAHYRTRTLMPGKPVTIYVAKPAIQSEPTASTKRSISSPWLDMQATPGPIAVHSGVKWAVTNFNDPGMRITVDTKVYFQLKNPI